MERVFPDEMNKIKNRLSLFRSYPSIIDIFFELT